MEIAGISIANATTRANVVFEGVTSVATGGGGVSWLLPTNAYTASFEKCNVYPVWTFAQLPTGANVLEGDEFDISDSPPTLPVIGARPSQRVAEYDHKPLQGSIEWHGLDDSG